MANPTGLPPPPINPLKLVNNGAEAIYNQINNNYFICYASDSQPVDIIGNSGPDGIHFVPTIPSTDPPSHFIFIEKDFNTNCAFYPVIDGYNTLFAIAWLETTPSGRLDLKYADVTTGPTSGPSAGIIVAPETPIESIIYFYPMIATVDKNVKTQNIALSDIQIIDTLGNVFIFDSTKSSYRGVEMTLPAQIFSFRWSQAFRQKVNQVSGILTDIPRIENNYFTTPLPGMNINIYHGHSNILFQRLQTDSKGRYSVQLADKEYIFEVETQNISVIVNQVLL